MDGVVDVSGRVVGDFGFHTGGQFLLDLLHLRADALDHVERVRVWQNPDAHEHSLLAGEPDFGIVIFRAEHDVGDVADPDEVAFVLSNDELLEIVDRVQIGVRGQIDLKERAFGVADSREKIVSRQRVADLGGTDIQCRHPVGLHPDAHREGASAQNVGPLHAADRRQTRLHQPNKVIRDLVRLKNVRRETQISRGRLRIGGLDVDDGNSASGGRSRGPDRLWS